MLLKKPLPGSTRVHTHSYVHKLLVEDEISSASASDLWCISAGVVGKLVWSVLPCHETRRELGSPEDVLQENLFSKWAPKHATKTETHGN